MSAEILDNPLYYVVVGLLGGVVGFRIGWRSGGKLLLPLVQGLFGFVLFAVSWRAGGAIDGALAVVGWALGNSLVSIRAFRQERQGIDRRVIGARAYREWMMVWLRTGRGPESEPFATAGRHVAALLLFVAAATVSANLLSLVLGAMLLNAMNAYVAALLVSARRIWRVRLLAWNGWSLVRVAAYVMLGSACAAPLAATIGYPARPGELRLLLLAGAAGVLLDLVLKLILSRPCGRVLAAALQPEA